MLLTISYFVLVLFFVFMLQFMIAFRSIGFDWAETVLFSFACGFGMLPGIMWLIASSSMSLVRAVIWADVILYAIALSLWAYKKWGGMVEPAVYNL